jgi:transposase
MRVGRTRPRRVATTNDASGSIRGARDRTDGHGVTTKIDCRGNGLLANVVQVFGAARAHQGYLFANARTSRIKLLVHDGFGVWCAARRLNVGGFVWPRRTDSGAAPVTRTNEQFDALVLGLPWQCAACQSAVSRRAMRPSGC